MHRLRMAVFVLAAVGCSRSETRSRALFQAAESHAASAESAGPCACKPESRDRGRKSLECYCAESRCPNSPDAALAALMPACAPGGEVSVVRHEGCGVVELSIGNGFSSEILSYDATSQLLVGAERTTDMCGGSPCTCQTIAGRVGCKTARACTVCGPSTDGAPACVPGGTR